MAARFAEWPVRRARLLLVALLALLAAAATVPLTVGKGEVASVATFAAGKAPAARARPRDEDLKLYDVAIARIRQGENYYSFIAQEHRKAFYPVRPGLAVRLPTLAYIDAALGVEGDQPKAVPSMVAIALMLATIWAWWRRLGDELGADEPAQQLRRIGTALMFLGASLGLNVYYFVLHELWAGMLIALAMGLHRPRDGGGAWVAAWLAAALALAIREHTLPFVLLLAAYALWRRAWTEAAAWAALVVLFGLGLAWHLHLVALHTLPTDPVGPSWLAMRGLGGWLSNVVLSSNLRFLPHWLAGPLVVLMVFGWAGWKSPAGAFATLLYLGYGVAFMVAGRNDNFYWGAVIAPAMFIGLAFVPLAARSLWRAAFPR
ncbi:MAG: hypothetical protein JSS36_00535 [Proteobacteria bacterium]|nr:hypothetical protein [Pseudomonadota bacterium]